MATNPKSQSAKTTAADKAKQTKEEEVGSVKRAGQAAPPEPEEDEEEDEDEEDEEEDEDEEDEEEDEDEEDEEEDEDEEDEEEDVEAPREKARPAATATPAPLPGQEPGWWIPLALLSAIVLLAVFGFFGAFNGLARALRGEKAHLDVVESTTTTAAASAPPVRSTPTVVPPKPTMTVVKTQAPTVDPDPAFGARRILIAYDGATNSTQKRKKEEAKKLADETLDQLKKGAKFEDLAAKVSDEPGAASTGGNLGRFKRNAKDPALMAIVESLKVNQMSEVVETKEGYQIVVRTF
ncbi:MAG: peptidylprolyl isomerase [Polyangiaceae bacterium]